MATAYGFQITREQYGAIVQVLVVGEVDLATAPQLHQLLGREPRDGPGIIVVDLSEVTFMDSSGLHALVVAHEDHGERLGIILSPPAARLIDLVGLRDTLPIIEG